tara:strand:+ start:154 stop:450 length:297 start_codon:yes stop_codon:yes gene_type:complete
MSKDNVYFNAIEMGTNGEDSTFHKDVNENVNLLSVPIEKNNLSNTEEPYPKVLDTIKARLEFKGNIKLSESGKSWNIFRDKLDSDDDLVSIDLSAVPF